MLTALKCSVNPGIPSRGIFGTLVKWRDGEMFSISSCSIVGLMDLALLTFPLHYFYQKNRKKVKEMDLNYIEQP